MSDEWMDSEYGYSDPWGAPAYSGSFNIQNPAPWDGGYSNSFTQDLPSTDPASPWYRPPADYSPIMPNQLPSGGGAWQNMDTGAEGSIYNPGYSSGAYGVPNQASVTPGGGYTNPADSWLQSRQAGADASWNNFYALTRPGVAPAGGGGGGAPGGQRAIANQTPQMISLGTPERRMYDHYTKNILDPSGMAADPAYQFLFNQGEQALKRNLAAQKMTLSGKSMNDTAKYGQGMAFNFMNQMLPQYRGAAQEELARFMGPAGLLPRYAAQNNATISQAGQETAARDLMPMYQQMLAGGMGGGGAVPSIGYGGMSSSYNPARATENPPQAYQPRLAQATGDNGYNLYDLMDESSFT